MIVNPLNGWIDRVRAALEARRAETGWGYVVVLGSAPREEGKGIKHGVGRSALADRLAEALGAERLSTGKVFRDMARDRDLSIEEFHRQIPAHPEWDADLDRRVMGRIDQAKATGRFLVVDSNLAAILGEPDLAVRVDVPDPVRARRVMEGRRYGDRQFATEKEALAFLDGRSEQEVRRYADHPDPMYRHVDLTDSKAFGLTVDNTGSLEDAVKDILASILARLEGDA
ncbi:MAG: AAA family ATPase [Planctomycetota bacterium]